MDKSKIKKAGMSKGKKIAFWAIGVLAVLTISLTTAAMMGGPKKVDLKDKSPEEIREYLHSDEFRGLDDQARRQAGMEAMTTMITERAREFSEVPAEQRDAYLDEMIDGMQARREEWQKKRQEEGGQGPEGRQRDRGDPERTAKGDERRDSSRRSGGGGGRRSPSPERFRARSERMEPVTRAQMREFREAMQKRMEERGVEHGFRR